MEKPAITFAIIKNLKEAEQLWRELASQNTIYDTWEFRFCFYKYFNYELFFCVGYMAGEPIGLMPLQYNSIDHCLEFFGGSYMENNKIFIKNGFEPYIALFYQQIKQKSRLEYIDGNDNCTINLAVEDYKYILPLEPDWTSYEDYLTACFDRKRINEFHRKIRKVEANNVEVTLNNFEDIEILFEYSIAHFGEHSSFKDRPHQKEIFRDLLKLSFPPYLATYRVNGEIQGISFCLIYKKILESFNTVTSPTAIKYLREFMTLKKIDTALNKKLEIYDSFVGDYGWKENWHFKKIPQYKFSWPEDKTSLENIPLRLSK